MNDYHFLKKYIYISTPEIFGSSNQPVKEDSIRYNPSTPYALSKLMSESLIRLFQKSHKNQKFIIARFSNFYGPMQGKNRLIPKVLKSIRLKKKFNFKVIEDSSHALGGSYLGKKIGNCEYSHMSVFSFHPVKMITTGEGGAITTNSKTLDDKVSLLRTHGITKEDKKFHNKPHGSWYYEQQVLGFNYRLTEIQAALGISQLKR